MKMQFKISVMYGQIVVYRTHLERPGLLWENDHVAQGFAWDHEIVSFGVPDHDGMSLLEVNVGEARQSLSEQTLWAAEVPFDVTTGEVEVGTVMMMNSIKMPIGKHSLIFEGCSGGRFDSNDYAFFLRLSFSINDNADFKILRKGYELTADKVLRKDARRA
jgi:Competence protein J (ComJ)